MPFDDKCMMPPQENGVPQDSMAEVLPETNITRTEVHTLTSRPLLYPAVTIMALTILVGTFGNTLVILAVQRSKKLHTISNVFIVNLSLCDLLFVLGVLPFNIFTYITDGWPFNENLCKFVGFLSYTLSGTTLVSITLIAWNRYTLVTCMAGYQRVFSYWNIMLMILASWALPVVSLLPAMLGVWGEFGYVPMMVTCNLLLNHASQSFKVFLLAVRAVIPCVLIIYCYLVIYQLTHRSHTKIHKNMRNAARYDAHVQKQEMRLTKMMAVIFLVFVLSYFPCTVTGIIDWNTILSKEFHMYCQITVYIGSAINPLIYGLMNTQFREAYIKLVWWNHHGGSKLRSLKVVPKPHVLRKQDMLYDEENAIMMGATKELCTTKTSNLSTSTQTSLLTLARDGRNDLGSSEGTSAT